MLFILGGMTFMGWFQRHLNWTIVLVAIGAWLFAWFLVESALLIGGMAYLPFPGEPYVAPDPYSSSHEPIFDIQAWSYVATFISLPVFLWTLQKKNYSWMYLCLFLPPLIPVPNASVFFWFVLVPFWLVGLITLLILENKKT